jgi:hypothetical protein
MPSIEELQAEERRAYRELQEAVAGLVEEVGERDAERVMQAVYDGLARISHGGRCIGALNEG